MKIKVYIIGLLLVAMAVTTSCEKDNYDPPKFELTGHVVYKGQALGVRTNGVQLELWQHGYKLFTKIPVYVAQDGSFSAKLFDGDYKLTAIQGNGPWVSSTDSIDVHIDGNTEIDFPVTPYFLIQDESYNLSNGILNAQFSLEKIADNGKLEKVVLLIGSTTIADNINNDAVSSKGSSDISDLSQPIDLQVNVPSDLLEKGYFFVRIGVKTVGSAELLYSESKKINVQ